MSVKRYTASPEVEFISFGHQFVDSAFGTGKIVDYCAADKIYVGGQSPTLYLNDSSCKRDETSTSIVKNLFEFGLSNLGTKTLVSTKLLE